jgi:hypothetical protein
MENTQPVDAKDLTGDDKFIRAVAKRVQQLSTSVARVRNVEHPQITPITRIRTEVKADVTWSDTFMDQPSAQS